MTAPEFSVAEELRFLAAQCSAQAEGRHRDQDALFLARLAAQLEIINDLGAKGVALIILEQTFAPGTEELRKAIRLAGTLINDAAARLERRFALGMGDAA